MSETSEQYTHQSNSLDSIISNETDKFLNSLKKQDFSIAGLGGSLTIQPIKKRIKDFLTSDDIGDNIKQFAGLNIIGKLVLDEDLINKINTFKKEIIAMKVKYEISNTLPTEADLNHLREAIGITNSTSQQSQTLETQVRNSQRRVPQSQGNHRTPPKNNPRPPKTSEQQHQREAGPERGEISPERVKQVWEYIVNGGKYHSYTLGDITWGWGEYKHVCTTGAYEVASRLTGYPRPQNTDRNGYDEKLKAMHYTKFLDKVNPKNPGSYTPKDGDVAVRPKFQLDSGKITQHMATYINGHRVSDTIQPKMSCYSTKNEPQVIIYRYSPDANSNTHGNPSYRQAA